MRRESSQYRLRRVNMVTRPVAYVVFGYAPNLLDQSLVWEFSRDFSTAPVRGLTREKLECIRHISGASQRMDPVTGVSTVGALTIEMVDVRGLITRYVSDPARPLSTAVADTPPLTGGGLSRTNRRDVVSVADAQVRIFGDIAAYPDLGFITIDDEDIGYRATFQSGPEGVFGSLTRACRGTVSAAHAAGALVHNGEQIRRGTRMRLDLGYEELDEIDYGPGPGYAVMNVVQVQSTPGGWTIVAQDVQTLTRRKIFTKSSTQNPFVLKGNPLRLALRILLSTGNGSNGSNDVYEYENGAAVPRDLVDGAMFRYYENQNPFAVFHFRESSPTEAKEFVEMQCLRPMNLFPIINQLGQYSVRQATPTLQRIGVATRATVQEVIPPVSPPLPTETWKLQLEDGGALLMENGDTLVLEH